MKAIPLALARSAHLPPPDLPIEALTSRELHLKATPH